MSTVTTVHGRVITTDEMRRELTVELRDGQGGAIGAARVAPDGRFSLLGLEVALHRRHALVLDVHHEGVLVDRVPVVSQHWKPEIAVEVPLDPATMADDLLRRVRGQLRDKEGRPLAGKRVEVLERGFRTEHKRGEAMTDDEGRFAIDYPGQGDIVVRARDSKGSGKALVESTTVFDPSRSEVVDLMIGGGTWAGPSEFERVDAAVGPQLGDRLARLSADDLTFLEGATGLSPEQIDAYARARVLAAGTKLPVAAVYTCLRAGLSDSVAGLAAADPGVVRATLTAAVEGNVAPPTLGPRIDSVVKELEAIRTEAIVDGTDGKTTPIGVVAHAVVSSRAARERLVNIAARHASPKAFWAAVERDGPLNHRIGALRFASDVVALVGPNEPLVQELVRRHSSGELRSADDLASYDAAAWHDLLSKAPATIDAPDDTPGRTKAARTKNYADGLAETVESAFPTASIRAGIEADGGDSRVGAFLARHPDFAFGEDTVDGFVARNAPKTSAKTVADLRDVERLSKVAKSYKHIKVLRDDGLTSSRAIARTGKQVFIDKYAKDFGGRSAAETAWERAAWLAAAAQHVVAASAPIFNVSLAVLPYEPPAASASLPDWEKLFGSVEVCECEQCRTVTSPSAYYTDILHFFGERTPWNGATPLDVLFRRRADLGEIELVCENTNTPLPYIDLVNEVLERVVAPQRFRIRGSQSQLNSRQLSNAGVLDFATAGFPLSDPWSVGVVRQNELWWVRSKGWRYVLTWNQAANAVDVVPYPQTSASAEELSANPEHVNDSAYEKLAGGVYPWSLPFDLPLEQVTAFAARMGLTRDELMRRYQPSSAQPTSSAAQIAGAAIGLGEAELEILVGQHPASSRPWVFWGATVARRHLRPGQVLHWADQLQPVRTLLERARIDYGQLVDLLELEFINASGALSIQPAAKAEPGTCDTRQLAIANLDETALDRIHRFIRLQRRLVWSQRDLDRVLWALKATDIDQAVVTIVSDIERLRRVYRLPVQQIASWYAPIDTLAYLPTSIDETKSLYAQLFQNPSVVKHVAGSDPFALDANGQVATSQPLTATAPGATADAVTQIRAAIAGALGTSADDLALLLDGPRAVAGQTPTLTLETLSRLHRRVSLARALKLKVADLLTLLELTGIDPFVDVNATPRPSVTPADTARSFALTDALAAIKSSRLTIAQLAYLLRGEVSAGSTVAPTEQALATTLNGLRSGLAAIRVATIPAPDPQGQLTGTALTGLGWKDETVQAVVAMLAGTAVYTAQLANLPAAVTLPADMPVAWAAGILSFTGPMTNAQRGTLLGLSNVGAYQTAARALYDAPRTFVTDEMKTFVAPLYVAPLATLANAVQFPEDISDRISYDADAGTLSFLGTMTNAEEATLLGLWNDNAYQTAIRTLHDAPATYVPPAAEAFLAAADASTLFDAALDPSARFAFVLERLLAYLRTSRSRALLTQTFTQALRMEPAMIETLLYDWADEGAASAHRPAEDFLAGPFVTSSDAMSRDRFPDAFRALTRLLKVARLVSTLFIGRDDLASLIAHSDPTQLSWLGLLDFASLPASAGDPPASFDAWREFFEVFRWSAMLPSGSGGPTLLDLLARAETFDPAVDDAVATKTAMVDDWVALTDWAKTELEALLGPSATPANGGLLGYLLPRPGGPGAPRRSNPFAAIATWRRVGDAMDAATTFGATCALCAAWSQPAPSTADARAIQQTARAKLGDDAWLEAFRKIRDRLREQQRDALVDYLITNPPAGQRWTEPDDLFGCYLIDVEMSSCMVTSRMKQAIGSAQLLGQRCLMGLEPAVRTGADPGWALWDWEQSETLWGGARSIFLWPENWLQPDLRRDASEPFEQLVHTLQQSPVTDDTAESAFLAYLEELYELSRMEVVGVHHQVEKAASGATEIDVLHVIGRTQSKPSRFAYRQLVSGAKWTPWQRVKLDIEADSVLPVVWNRKLMLFWPLTKNEQQQTSLTMPAAGSTMPTPKASLSVQLAWSVFENGKWGAKQLTPNRTILNYQMRPQAPMIALTSRSSDVGGWMDIEVIVNGFLPPFPGGALLGTDLYQDIVASLAQVGVTGAAAAYLGPSLSFSGGLAAPRYPSTGKADDPWSSSLHLATSVTDPMPVDSTILFGRATALDKAQRLTLNLQTPGTTSLFQDPLLGSARTFEVAYPRQESAGYAGADHFFFQDAVRSFYVERMKPSPPGGTPAGGSGGLPPPPPNQLPHFLFKPFYHPFVDTFGREVLRHGIDGLFTRDLQLRPYNYPKPPSGMLQPFSFSATYQPSTNVWPSYPVEEIDYSFSGAYAQYNWELFVHAPLVVAQRLMDNQQHSSTKKWLEFMFNPMDASADPAPQKFWKPKIFYETTSAQYAQQQIQELLDQLAGASVGWPIVQQVQDWRADPFDPHVVARLRTTAYQKQIVMRYLDNLIAWGDKLFTENTIESINQATQKYVLASEILGPRPEQVPARVEPVPQTYNSMAPLLDEFSDALVAAESLLAGPPVLVNPAPTHPSVALAPMRYFCVPQNQKLLDYRKTIDDRLFKIRHCQSIEGVRQQLPLFDPPIDPGLLVRAAAAGVNIASALSAENAPLPFHRFSYVLPKAKELAAEVKSLGAALLSALEKRDAEQLAVLRQTQEQNLLEAVLEVRRQQIADADQALASLETQRQLIQQRHDYYERQPFVNAGEAVHLALTSASIQVHEVSAATELVASILSIVPNIKIGAPTGMGATFGGDNLAPAAHALSTFLASTVQILQSTAGLAQTLGGYQRRAEEWAFQTQQAQTEHDQIEQQIIGAQIRVAIAQAELANQQLQADNSQAALDLMQSKFTNEQLFDWMVGESATLLNQSYQLAYAMALRAERAYRNELGLERSNIVRFDHWDSLHRGLLAGERLSYDLARLETSHMELDRREHELRKTISLAQISPGALIALRETGECFVDLGETLYDLDHAGHYMRRLKTVSLTIPCIAGPYVGVHATATLLGSTIRMTDDPAVNPVQHTGAVEAIATSTGQNDSGLFEVNLHDERYLPFEGHGAAGRWQITLDLNANRFDFSTISDVLLNVSYTSRQGGDDLRQAALAALPAMQQVAFFDAAHDFSDDWYRFLHPADDAPGNALAFDLTNRFAYQPGGAGVEVAGIDVYLALDIQGTSEVKLSLKAADATGQPTGPDLLAGGKLKAMAQLDGAFFRTTTPANPIAPGPMLLSIAGADIPAVARKTVNVGNRTYNHLDPETVSSLYIVCRYQPVP
jgi:hypothetical protein